MDGSTVRPEGLRSRSSRIDAEHPGRRRVSKACEACRRLKEKCNGINPCARCIRTGRQCEFTGAHRSRVKERHHDSQSTSSESFCDPERIAVLEQIVEYFTHTKSFDKLHLHNLAASLKQNSTDHRINSSTTNGTLDTAANTSRDTRRSFLPTGELSHQTFSLQLQEKVAGELNESVSEPSHTERLDDESANIDQLGSNPSTVVEAGTQFPPYEIAQFLVSVFFDFAQTNYQYVDEVQLRKSMDQFYSSPAEPLDVKDAPWMCILLMTFAVGTQFAHLVLDTEHDGHQSLGTTVADRNAGMVFYGAACRLIPEVIALSTLESIQAFLLLTVYTLPIDAAGLSCTYLAIALRIATQNCLHREAQYDAIPSQRAELQRRIFWTAYTLERRICVFHGRPISLSKNDVDCNHPSTCPNLGIPSKVDTTSNNLAMIHLTEHLEEARNFVCMFKKADTQNDMARAAQSMSTLKSLISDYWGSLERKTLCRDLDPAKPLFRPNIHLALTYHLAHIFIGRSFIFNSDYGPETTTSNRRTTEWERVRDEMVHDCLESASAVIDLCQKLHDEIRLAKSSYTEFTSCAAAVLVFIAKRLNNNSRRLQKYCNKGFALLNEMSVGVFSGNSDKLVIDALESALKRLDERCAPPSIPDGNQTKAFSYLQFRNWASLRQGHSETSSGSITSLATSRTPGESQHRQDIPSLNQVNSSELGECSVGAEPTFQFHDLDAFTSTIPGLDEWFQYGMQ